MRLDEYWSVGPKTRQFLTESLGVEAAAEAIESGDVRTLVDAGLPHGRATRILRHANAGAALDLLATPDTRDVYNELLELVSEHAVTADARDRVRILTPLATRAAMVDRLDTVLAARDGWTAPSEHRRERALDIFESYDDAGGDRRAAVEAVLAARGAGLDSGVFAPLADLDVDALESALAALAGLSGGGGDRVGEGADDRLDALREQLGAVEDMAATPGDVLSAVQSGARGTAELREALARTVADRAGVDLARVRESMPGEAVDARSFVEGTLRTLTSDLRTAVTEREAAVADRLSGVLAETESEVEGAVTAVGDIGFEVSLARFALAFDLTRPDLVERRVTGVVGARNLALVDAGGSVQPVTYAVGDHDLSVPGANRPPEADRVAVLTGANSGGKTTLLETLCQVQLLAQMGLPVPADQAEIGVVDTVVFHRRHASFNAGVLESTLQTVVPPVTTAERTLMLVDEFEGITEPGRAADLLHGLVTLTVDSDALGVCVTHLADDLEPLSDRARVDGIFAEGLTSDLDLEVDYQPRFSTVGRSTPEFIVSRLVANSTDRAERSGYEHLAESVGERAVQRTLADARWSS
ncbi:MAG: DNA mismatch repair protein, MutS family [halophilic archaeon J07HX64]|jgi:DNA mismatch repair protein, MutS family|nr:MAG: DNA mismatch repair protein, MutS family [halophilic archaeon J07HX64]